MISDLVAWRRICEKRRGMTRRPNGSNKRNTTVQGSLLDAAPILEAIAVLASDLAAIRA
jgi:hypothetical protein